MGMGSTAGGQSDAQERNVRTIPRQTTAKDATCTEKEQTAKQSRGNPKKSEHNLRYAKAKENPNPTKNLPKKRPGT